MHNTMNLDSLFADDVEDEVGFDYQNAVAVFSQLIMTWNSAKQWLRFKQSDRFVDPIHERSRSGRAVLRDVIIDLEKVVLRYREIAKLILSGHVPVGAVSSSSADG